MNNYDNIEEALKNFTSQNEATLTQSASNLLQVLNFSFPVRKEMQVDIVTWYKNRKKTDPPQDLKNAAIKLGNAFFLGTIGQENSNDFQILFFAVEANQDLTRSNMASVTRALNRMSDSWPVLILFRQKHLISLALSERTDYTQQWRQGQKIGKVRILMNINCIKPHRGHLDLLCQMADQKENADAQNTYKHLLDTFSVENLTEKFYREIQNWYFWAVQNAQFPNKSDDPNDYKTYNSEAIIRLITRLIFVWFLKEKGLINPDLFDYTKLENVIKDFDPNDPENGNYYNAILQNLFFATLNQKIEDRKFVAKDIRQGYDYYDIKNYYRAIDLFISKDKNEIVNLFAQTPYVNGSLFSCLDDKQDNNGNKYNFDGFSNSKTSKAGIIKRAFIPNLLFFAGENATNANLADFFEKEEEKRIYQDVKMTGILTILSKYHFTIEENTPLDEQVALDPELLGKVFENLLGAFNPETKTKARKQTGSFYTPRQIVDYMVVQSLTRYFKAKCPKINEQDLHSLLEDNDLPKPENINEELTNSVVEAVCQCKIIDPACGSGAFPMGILQRLVSMLNKLDPDNSKWHEIVKNEALKRTDIALDNPDTKARDALINSIKDNFTRQTASPDYARKLYIIANCIHGVDIQTIAIQISKLRFFISLLCEQKTNDNPKDNFGIKPLPNLETKLVAADSLMPAAILKFENEIQEDFTNYELKQLMKQLADIRIRHIAPKDRKEKQDLERKDREMCGEINEMLVNRYGKIKNIEEPIKKLNNEISRLKEIINKCQEPKWEMREEATQTSFLTDETAKATRLVNVDVNKKKRDEAQNNIRNCEKEIERLKKAAKLDEYSEAVKQMTDWDPYDQNTSAPFFYPNWMFNVYNGFDIVIANPPYKQIPKGTYPAQKFPYSEEKDNGKQNLYKMFVEHGYNICAESGWTCMIVQESLMCDLTSQFTRQLLLTQTKIDQIVHFPQNTDDPEFRVFKSVITGTCIVMFQKEANMVNCFRVSIHNNLKTIKAPAFTLLSQQGIIDGGRYIEFPLLRNNEGDLYTKMRTEYRKLSDILIGSKQGNINTIYLQKIRSLEPTSIRIGKGDKIHRYKLDVENMMYAKETPDNYRLANENKRGYCVVTQNIASAIGNWRIHACRAECKKTDIVFLDSANIIYLPSPRDAALVVGLLNSRLMDWTFRTTSTNNHVNLFELVGLPLPSVDALSSPEADNLVSLVERAEKGEDVQNQIDIMVCQIYGLNDEEKQLIGL